MPVTYWNILYRDVGIHRNVKAAEAQKRPTDNVEWVAFLNNYTGIMNDQSSDNSAAYIQGWLNQLKNDKKFIVEASAKAQKTVDYILNQGS